MSARRASLAPALLIAGLGVLVSTPSHAGEPEPFEYMPPGVLTPESGTGRMDDTVYSPGMRFPIEDGPAFSNSQVWGNGGGAGPGGGQCDQVNYDYPWWDNYCETRSWDMPMCPSGQGHQGQDIRPATCDDLTHWTAASGAGSITNIGSYSVYVTTPDGTRYDYLHGGNNIVSLGQTVAQGDRLNRVSNEFGGTPTTIHLHFNIRMDVAGYGLVYAPTYMSLVESYQELMGLVGNGQGALESSNDCEAIVGWAQDGDDPEGPATVLVAFGGTHDDPNASVVEVLADRPRPDLCDALGSCDHGFEVEVPVRLRDNASHEVYAYVIGANGAPVELEASPGAFSCAPPPLPAGVRRPVNGPEVVAAWGFSLLWQAAWAPQPQLDALPLGNEFPERPVLVYSDDDPSQTRWLMDPGYKRRVASEEVASAWGLAWADAEAWPAAVLADVPEGTPLRPTPFLVAGDDEVLYAIDDGQCPLDDQGQPDPACEPTGGSGGDDSADSTGGDDLPGGTAADGDTGDSLPPGQQGGDAGGCGCRNDPGPPAGTSWLALLGLLWLRRGRRRLG